MSLNWQKVATPITERKKDIGEGKKHEFWSLGWQKQKEFRQTRCLETQQLETAEEQSGKAAGTETIQGRFRVCEVMQRAKV